MTTEQFRGQLKSIAQEYAQRMQMNHSDDGEKLSFDEWLQVMLIEEEKEDLKAQIITTLRGAGGKLNEEVAEEILKLINK